MTCISGQWGHVSRAALSRQQVSTCPSGNERMLTSITVYQRSSTCRSSSLNERMALKPHEIRQRVIKDLYNTDRNRDGEDAGLGFVNNAESSDDEKWRLRRKVLWRPQPWLPALHFRLYPHLLFLIRRQTERIRTTRAPPTPHTCTAR